MRGAAGAQKIRVIVAAPGDDAGDWAARIVAHGLRDAGMEVIYTGGRQTPEQIIETVLQEDADAIGLSVAAGGDDEYVQRVLELLRDRGVGDVVVEVVTPEGPTQAIIDGIRGAVGAAP
jgi:methylmalonyl-CoA mutase, C-terminal domain